MQTCGGRGAVLDRLVEIFRRSVPEHFAAARVAFDKRDFPRLRVAAHVLAGTLSAFSTMAGTIASALEDAAIEEDVERCASLVTKLGSTCTQLVEETRDLTFENLGV